MSQYKTKQFRKLLDKWNAKLAKDGFEDVEDNGAEPRLKRWDAHYFRLRNSPEQGAAKSTYFDRAMELLRNTRFTPAIDRKIWELHSQGKNFRQIAKATGCSLNMVYRRVDKYRKRIL